ncbi:MAG TPA: GntR family transcriptional regulator [Candidatus Dormibacteraeota bacterium]
MAQILEPEPWPVNRRRGARRRAEVHNTAEVVLPAALPGDRGRAEELEEILEGLVAGLRPGDLLPSERQLAERFGVARMTARQAVEAMAARGLVARLQGRGTFVTDPKFVQPETLTSFSEDMRRRGMTPGATVLAQEVVEASDVVAGRLQIAPASMVVRIERLRTAGGDPMALETASLPAARFPGLESLDLSGSSLYAMLEQRWGAAVHSAHQWVTAVRLTRRQADLLGTKITQPAFQFQRVTLDANAVPLEYVVSLYRGDRYEVHTRLERRDLTR